MLTAQAKEDFKQFIERIISHAVVTVNGKAERKSYTAGKGFLTAELRYILQSRRSWGRLQQSRKCSFTTRLASYGQRKRKISVFPMSKRAHCTDLCSTL